MRPPNLRGRVPRRMRRFPVPEMLPGPRGDRLWDITDSPTYACTSPAGGRMRVPLAGPCGKCGVDHAGWTRAHETIHAAISPESIPADVGATVESVLAAEDMRVNRHALYIGLQPLGVRCPDDAARWAAGFAAQASAVDLARMLVAAWGTADYGPLADASAGWTPPGMDPDDASALRDALRQSVTDSRALMDAETIQTAQGPRDPWNATVRVARYLDRFGAAADALQDGDPEDIPGGDPQDRDGPVGWGEMRVETARMPVRVPSPLSRKSVATDSGAVPRRMHRLAIDGRPFTYRRRAPGGTVLLDTSGSMSWSAGDVAAIVRAAPGATVALYSGNSDRTTGVLRIVADGGRRATDDVCDRHPGNAGTNIIDGPALRWLARMPEPRIWVSDAMVTGTGEVRTPLLNLDARSICRRGRIHRADEASEVPKLLGGR